MKLMRIFSGRWLARTHGVGPTKHARGFAAWRFGVPSTSGRFLGRRLMREHTSRDWTAFIKVGSAGNKYGQPFRGLF